MGWVRQLGRARQLGEASCLASAGRVTRVGETTFSHVNGLARFLYCNALSLCPADKFIAFQCGLSCQEFLLGFQVQE